MIKTTLCIVLIVFAPLSVAAEWVNVANVAEDDTLAVREHATHQSSKIGELAPRETFIPVLDSKMDGESTWLKVAFDDAQGWINQRFTQPSELAHSLEPLSCLGTEPFWSLAIDEGQADYESFEGKTRSLALTRVRQSTNHSNQWLLALKNGSDRGTAFLMRTGQCSDDMSDRSYPYQLSIELPDGSFLSGCCSVAD